MLFQKCFSNYKMTKIIGLTGGIGSGKSTIAGFFKENNVPVYIADDEARKIMDRSDVLAAIRKEFGNIIFDGGEVNRKKLAEIVFNDKEKLAVLNSIIHPAVKQDFKVWVEERKKEPFVLYEAAILFESGRYKDCDLIITVTADTEARIKRVIKRDNTTRENVLSRMKMQWDDEERIKKSDFVIHNNDLENAKEDVLKILKILDIKQNQD
jgi:dephospho-CoA kinase